MRRFAILTSVVLAVMMAVPVGAGADAYPDVIPLPDGFQPEGVVVGAGHDVYTGSLGNGAIWKGDLRTGQGDILVPGVEGGLAVGMDFDERSGYLFVAGGLNGTIMVYDGETGATVETFSVFAPFRGFVNDVIVTRTAAYFTNSFAPELYRVPLDRNGRIARSPETISLGGDFTFIPGPFVFNANGIEATPDGKTLFVVNSAASTLYTVDPVTGEAAEVDLGGALPSGDGLLLSGNTIYVVQNRLNQIAEIRLSSDLSSGSVVGVLTDDDFVVPTTASRFGNGIYAVNAKFGNPTPDTADYEIVRVDR